MSQLILLLTLLLITFLFSVNEEQESGNFSKESRSLQSVRLDKKQVLDRFSPPFQRENDCRKK